MKERDNIFKLFHRVKYKKKKKKLSVTEMFKPKCEYPWSAFCRFR